MFCVIQKSSLYLVSLESFHLKISNFIYGYSSVPNNGKPSELNNQTTIVGGNIGLVWIYNNNKVSSQLWVAIWIIIFYSASLRTMPYKTLPKTLSFLTTSIQICLSLPLVLEAPLTSMLPLVLAAPLTSMLSFLLIGVGTSLRCTFPNQLRHDFFVSSPTLLNKRYYLQAKMGQEYYFRF